MFNKLKNAVSAVNDAASVSSRKITDFVASAPDTIHSYADKFTESDLWDKISTAASAAGSQLLFMVLALFYSLETAPARDKMMIAGALGYFILPVDILPDLMPGGYADDLSVLTVVYKSVKDNMSEEAMSKARAKTDDIFGNNESGAAALS